jgi:hypothetical protein
MEVTPMTTLANVLNRPLTGFCYSSDKEILDEICEALSNEIGDIRHGSIVLDTFRRQITGKLEDGRTLRMTVVFE